MTWGVVAATAPELRPALRALRARARRLRGRTFHVAPPFVFALGGIGAGPASRCAADLVDLFHPHILVSTGFAGGLARDLETGTIIAGGVPGLASAPEALRAARQADPRARVGQIVAVERVLLSDAEREEVGRRGERPLGGAAELGAVPAARNESLAVLGVDMESEAVGRMAGERGVGFLCLKAVLDTPGAPLASRYESVALVLGEILRRPAVLGGLLKDARRARIAGRKLADFYRALAGVLLTRTGC